MFPELENPKLSRGNTFKHARSLSLSLSVYLSIRLFFPHIRLFSSVYPSVSVCLFVWFCLSTPFLSIFVYLTPCFCLLCLPLCLFLFVCRSVLFVYPPRFCMHTCLFFSVYPSVSVCPSVMSVYLPTSVCFCLFVLSFYLAVSVYFCLF